MNLFCRNYQKWNLGLGQTFHRRIERHDMLCKRLLQRIRRKPVVVAHTKDRHKFKDIPRHLVRAQNRQDDFFNQLYRRDKKADCSSELSMNVSSESDCSSELTRNVSVLKI
jgi:hypothetical protein